MKLIKADVKQNKTLINNCLLQTITLVYYIFIM